MRPSIGSGVDIRGNLGGEVGGGMDGLLIEHVLFRFRALLGCSAMGCIYTLVFCLVACAAKHRG